MANESSPDPESSLFWALFQPRTGWATILLLILACALVPVMISVLLNPWLGLLSVTGSLWAWGRFGPPPFPGFLPGVLFLWGIAVIGGSALACLKLAISQLVVR